MENPFNTSDKAARQYCISVDWLSVSCRDMGFVFWDQETQPSGYRLVRMGHGSKIFAELYDVYDPDGVHVAELHAKPYNKGMDEHSIILKADNALLYQSDGIEQFFACVNALALYYKGINRLDICCDQNEFYNGYQPTSLINQYLDTSCPIIKLGINHGFTHFDKGIYGTATGNGLTLWSKMPLVRKEQREKRAAEIATKNEELKKAGLPLIDTTEAHAIETQIASHGVTAAAPSKRRYTTRQENSKRKFLSTTLLMLGRQRVSTCHVTYTAWKCVSWEKAKVSSILKLGNNLNCI